MDTRKEQMDRIAQLLATLGFVLEKEQPHISGERFLMAPNKLVLVGVQTANNLKVIIKISRLIKGREEIRQEKRVRDILSSFAFTKKVMFFPSEIFFGRRGEYLILVTEFIPQEKVFIARPLAEQFSIIIHSFKTREAFHSRTFKRVQKAARTFPVFDGNTYLDNFKGFKASVVSHYKNLALSRLLSQSQHILKQNIKIIEKHNNYLIHGDFVPHNFIIRGKSLYILDYSAFHFGNKYEEWARLLNYMVIHNPALERRLKKHIVNMRGETDYLDLRLMRIYKIGFLLAFYAQSLDKTSSDLHVLTKRRIKFWQEVLQSVIDDKNLDEGILEDYLKNRDHLRSPEEIKRQKEFTLV